MWHFTSGLRVAGLALGPKYDIMMALLEVEEAVCDAGMAKGNKAGVFLEEGARAHL